MRQSYLDYAMSVIVGCAADVRDKKPVHRRCVRHARARNEWNKAYKKSARVVGDVIGKYHPHGDTAVYDNHRAPGAAPFSMRYPLVDGQGNFARWTATCRRPCAHRGAHVAHRAQATAESPRNGRFRPTTTTEHEPSGAADAHSNLPVNGQTGIAVGMATNIPPHNLTETINACVWRCSTIRRCRWSH